MAKNETAYTKRCTHVRVERVNILIFTLKKMSKIHKNMKSVLTIYKTNYASAQLFVFWIKAIEKKVGKLRVKTFDYMGLFMINY